MPLCHFCSYTPNLTLQIPMYSSKLCWQKYVWDPLGAGKRKICICAHHQQHPTFPSANNIHRRWMTAAGCYWLDKQNQNCVRREGYFNVILSSPTLDKGLAALKLAITSKHSLWCSNYSLMGTWLMADALKARSKRRDEAKVVYKCKLEVHSPQLSAFLHLHEVFEWRDIEVANYNCRQQT